MFSSPRNKTWYDAFLLVVSEIDLGEGTTAAREDILRALQHAQDTGTLNLTIQNLTPAGKHHSPPHLSICIIEELHVFSSQMFIL